MIANIIFILVTTIMIALLLICFFDLGFIAKELVLYSIEQSKKADKEKEDRQMDLVRKIIDNSGKF